MLLTNAKSLSEKPRKSTFNGRDYIIIPVVAIKEGVLNEELVLSDDIRDSVFDWRDRPVVLGHPEVNGEFVSARDPEILDGCSVGRFFNVAFNDGKLRGEIWIDVAVAEKTKEGKELLGRISRSERMEVSTAYVRDLENKSGKFNGKEYKGVARNIRPDHLAILLHDIGACSWSDGCGTPRVNKKESYNILDKARTPTYSGTTTADWSKPTLADYYQEAVGIADLTEGQRNKIAEGSLLGDPNAETFNDLSFFPVVTPGGDLSRRALLAVISGRGSQADISSGALQSSQEVARSLLEEEFAEEENRSVLNEIVKFVKEVIYHARDLENKNNAKEVNMDYRQKILDDGRMGFTAEELEGMSDETVKKIWDHLETMSSISEPEPNTDDGGGEQKSEGISSNSETVNTESPCHALEVVVDLVGGSDEAITILTNAHKDRVESRMKAIKTIVSNTNIGEEALQQMKTDALVKIASSLSANKVRDFSGQPIEAPITANQEHEEDPLVVVTF